MSLHNRAATCPHAAPTETWTTPAIPRNRAAALVAGVALVVSFAAHLLWRAYGPPYPPRPVTPTPRTTPPNRPRRAVIATAHD